MSYANNKITAPVSIKDVQRALGIPDTDLYHICVSDNINLWARYKPIRIPHGGNDVGDQPSPINDSVRAAWSYGVQTKYAYDGTTFNALTDFVNGVLRNGNPSGSQMSDNELAKCINNGWLEWLPLPNLWFCRLTDFVKTVDGVGNPSWEGYNHDAKPYATKVYNSNNVAKSMAPAMFPDEESRDITIADGETFIREVPNDTAFLDLFSKSVDKSIYDQGGYTAYTKFTQDSPASMTIIEAIQSHRGGIQLTTSFKDGSYANAERGIVILKKDNQGIYNIITWQMRNVISVSNGHVNGYTNDDDLYYNRFTITQHSTGGTTYYKVNGTGNTSNNKPTDAEIERLANWFCFGIGTGTNPNFGYVWIGSGGTAEQRQAALQQAITQFRAASIAPNRKYLDLTRKGFERVPSAMYGNGGTYETQCYDNNYNEKDNLVGDLLAIEFYCRRTETKKMDGSTSVTISPYVLIPFYTYPLHITRVGSGQSANLDDENITFVLYEGSGVEGFAIMLHTNTVYQNCDAALNADNFHLLSATIKNGTTTLQTVTLYPAAQRTSGVSDSNDGTYNGYFYSFSQPVTYNTIILTGEKTVIIDGISTRITATKTFTL